MRAASTRALVLCLVATLCLPLGAFAAQAREPMITFHGVEPNVRSFAANFRLMNTMPADSVGPTEFVLADEFGYVNVLRPAKRGFRREWKSFHLGGTVKGLYIHDLGKDGVLKLIVHTNDRLFVFDARSHSLLWESVESDFTDISTIALGQFDESDPQDEFLILAGGVLLIYDGVRYNREWEGTEPFTAQEMVVGDVDGDGDDEVVMNTGFIFGALSHTVEWQTEDFGTRLGLIDIDDDGILEVVGEGTGGKLRVFDIDKRQEKQDL
jgi:hypothetical protein